MWEGKFLEPRKWHNGQRRYKENDSDSHKYAINGNISRKGKSIIPELPSDAKRQLLMLIRESASFVQNKKTAQLVAEPQI